MKTIATTLWHVLGLQEIFQALLLKHLDSLQSLCLVACDSEVTVGAVQKDHNLKQPWTA